MEVRKAELGASVAQTAQRLGQAIQETVIPERLGRGARLERRVGKRGEPGGLDIRGRIPNKA